MKDETHVMDWDNAYNVSNGDCTVYFDTYAYKGRWYVSVDIDTETFTDRLFSLDGPYVTQNDAVMGGLNAALEWFHSNGLFDYEKCTRTHNKERLSSPITRYSNVPMTRDEFEENEK